MLLLSQPSIAKAVPCPYLPNRSFIQEYLFATAVDAAEYGLLLRSGWRRFARFFFRPHCNTCRACRPCRVSARDLTPSRSQRRILTRGSRIQFSVTETGPSDEAWRVYQSHSRQRFGDDPGREDFEKTFYDSSVPTMRSEYRIDGILVAIGFLDRCDDGLSSAYFAFDPCWKRLGLGSLSVFRESAFVKELGLDWYYLGYWVSGCPSMDYKARFQPMELMEWTTGRWLSFEESVLNE